MIDFLCHSRFPAALAVVIALCALLLAAACAGEPTPPPETRAPALTPPPPPTLTPTPALATPTPTPGRQDSLSYPSPNISSDAAATPEQGACPQHGYCGQLEPGERLTAAAWLDDDRMYLADHAGSIRLLNITTGGIKTVLTGLTAPQGLTALDGRLYVSDTGNLCDLIAQLPGTDAEISRCRVIRPEAKLRALLERVNARILSYRIAPDGSLDQPQVVVEGLVVTNRHHSAHGLANDGRYIYASIGHPEERVRPNGGFFHRQAPPFLAASGRRADLMGTIARFQPGDTEVAVWAAGLRNTYGISITPDGTIYGADNDQQDGIQLLPAGGVERHY